MEYSTFRSLLSSPSNTIFLPFFLLIVLLPSSHSDSDYNALVYKNCPNQTLMATTNPLSQTLSSLFQALIRQSSKSSFFRETAGNNGVFLSGLFQCRGDISIKDCHNCVTRLDKLSNSLCAGADSGRVQLRGCYVRYEPDGIPERPKHDLLHKVCGEPGAVSGGFKEARDAAFAAMEDGVARSGNGYYEARYDAVRAVAQCQGDLWGCDCVECVSDAVEVAREDCGGSLTGEVYLDGCYMSYARYWPEGDEKSGSSGKLVAIVLGGAASLGLGFILLVFLKSCGKKDDD